MSLNQNQTALITGGAKRLGRDISLFLAEEGYDIALHYQASMEDAQSTKQDIEKRGRRCLLMQGDLTDPSFYTRCIETTAEALGVPTLLVNNASLFEKIPFDRVSPQVFDRYFNLHVKAPFFLSQAFANTGTEGAIINLLDSRVDAYETGHFIYTLTKKTLKEMTLLLAKTLAPKIRVNGICPGPILPPEHLGKDYLNQVAEKTPMKRPGDVKDILSAVQYLTRSTYVNGEILFVDGGGRLI